MSGSKGRDTRRNDGFRIADARQVRVEALERTVRTLRAERDAAQRERDEARRLAGQMERLTASAQNVAMAESGAADLVRRERDALRVKVAEQHRALKLARAERLTWWDRLFGRAAA